MTGSIDAPNDALTPAPAAAQGKSGPGRLVRQARETRGLTLDDLAAQIKLARNTLDAIERDDFAHLNEPVYVRGYYRKLSKVLPVTEAELLAAYERLAGHKEPPHPAKLILAGGSELSSERTISPKLAIGVIALGLLVGAAAFWGKSRSNGSAPVTPAVEPVPAAPSNPAPVAEPAPAVIEPSAGAAPAGVLPAGAEPSLAEIAAPPASALATPSPAPVPAPAAPATGGVLQLQFNASSWTDIRDATGRQLLSGLVEGGGSQSLDGTPPFVVFLGNAPAVSITYKGQPVDTTPFRKGDNTARITLR